MDDSVFATTTSDTWAETLHTYALLSRVSFLFSPKQLVTKSQQGQSLKMMQHLKWHGEHAKQHNCEYLSSCC